VRVSAPVATGGDVRVALLGDGVIAAEHAMALSTLGCRPHVVVGVSDVKVRAFAGRYEIDRWSTSLDSALDDGQVQAVVVATPNDAHAPQTLAALASDRHVLCEVPLATSLATAREVSARAAACDRISMVCQTQRYLPAVHRLRQLAETGVLDPIQILSLAGLRRRHDENIGWKGVPRDWIDSVVWHHGSHAVDTALWLLNDQVEFVRTATARPDPADGRPLDLSIQLETISGRMATLVLSYSLRRPASELVVVGERETYRVSEGVLREPLAGESEFGSGAGCEDPDRATSAAIRAQDGLFLAAIAGASTPAPVPADLVPVFEILNEVELQVAKRLSDLASRSRHQAASPCAGGEDAR
jgi:2-hydroxy-4-carboxymuconate semialdehyde hemiacetal dehydrogenase